MFYLVHYQNTVNSTDRTNAPTLKRYSLRYVLAFFHSYTYRSRICLIDSLHMGTHRAPSPCRRNRVPYHPFPEGSPATCRAICSVRRESDTDHARPLIAACDPSPDLCALSVMLFITFRDQHDKKGVGNRCMARINSSADTPLASYPPAAFTPWEVIPRFHSAR